MYGLIRTKFALPIQRAAHFDVKHFGSGGSPREIWGQSWKFDPKYLCSWREFDPEKYLAVQWEGFYLSFKCLHAATNRGTKNFLSKFSIFYQNLQDQNGRPSSGLYAQCIFMISVPIDAEKMRNSRGVRIVGSVCGRWITGPQNGA